MYWRGVENLRGLKKYYLLRPIGQNWTAKLEVIERIIKRRDRDPCIMRCGARVTRGYSDYQSPSAITSKVYGTETKLNSTCFGVGQNESEDRWERGSIPATGSGAGVSTPCSVLAEERTGAGKNPRINIANPITSIATQLAAKAPEPSRILPSRGAGVA